MIMARHALFVALALFAPTSLVCGQVSGGSQRVQLVPALVEGGDTMPVYMLSDVDVVAVMSPAQRRKVERLDKLTRNVVKVYPYARVTAKLLHEYERDLGSLDRARDRDLYVKLAEAELRAEFEEEVKNLTMSQGRVLVKLIDRETGHTGYELVKQLRGSFQAWMWQGVAKFFGNDLKDEYDPEGDDAVVEAVVRRIENGELVPAERSARTEKAQARLDKRKARLQRRFGAQ